MQHRHLTKGLLPCPLCDFIDALRKDTSLALIAGQHVPTTAGRNRQAGRAMDRDCCLPSAVSILDFSSTLKGVLGLGYLVPEATFTCVGGVE